jgi:rRNA maturation endonuclease Nob1
MPQIQLEEITYCIECDAEFSVNPNFEIDIPVEFCPYCGTTIEDLDEDYDDEEDLDDDDGLDD